MALSSCNRQLRQLCAPRIWQHITLDALEADQLANFTATVQTSPTTFNLVKSLYMRCFLNGVEELDIESEPDSAASHQSGVDSDDAIFGCTGRKKPPKYFEDYLGYDILDSDEPLEMDSGLMVKAGERGTQLLNLLSLCPNVTSLDIDPHTIYHVDDMRIGERLTWLVINND